MEASDSRGAGSTATTGALRGATVLSSTDGTAVVERAVQVAVGDRVRATVAAFEGGFAMLGWRGAVFAAKAPLSLQLGATYDFVVARTSPHVELALATPTQPAVTATHAAGSLPAQDASALVATFLALARSLGNKSKASSSFADAAALWSRGDSSAKTLSTLVRSLGHDHEARVLRLADAPPAARAAIALELQRDAKAIALLAQEDPAVAPHDRAAAAAFAQGLGAIERDNASRADAGLPQWLPLPACPQAGLLDARMFAGVDERESRGGEHDEARPFHVVLLLDFTELGAMRVDVAVEGGSVRATFVCADEATAASLHAAMPQLARELEDAGLVAPDLRVQRAALGVVPVADLALVRRDGEALVDVHA